MIALSWDYIHMDLSFFDKKISQLKARSFDFQLNNYYPVA